MRFKSLSILYILAGVFIVFLLIPNRVFKSDNENRVVTLDSNGSKTFLEVKKETLNYLYGNNDSINISSVFIKFRYNNITHALIVRRDSTVGIISGYNTELENVYYKDSIGYMASSLINLIDKQAPVLPFVDEQRMNLRNKRKSITLFVNPNDEGILQLKIDRENYREQDYVVITKLFAKLISKIKHREISAEDFFQLNKSQV